MCRTLDPAELPRLSQSHPRVVPLFLSHELDPGRDVATCQALGDRQLPPAPALPGEQWGVDGLHREFGGHSGHPQLLGTPSSACALTAPQHHRRAGSDPAGCWGPPALGEAGVDESSPHQDSHVSHSQELCRVPMGPHFGGFLWRVPVHGIHVTSGVGWDIRAPGTRPSLASLRSRNGLARHVCVRLCSRCANRALGVKVMRAGSMD